MSLYLGLDLGTSALKLLIVDAAQNPVLERTIQMATDHPCPRWSEQQPELWWQALVRAFDGLAREIDLSRIACIGLSGQMHGLVCLDATGAPLRPAILWNDGRADQKCTVLQQAFPNIAAITGAPAQPSFWAAKLLWMRTHEPDLFRRIRHVLLPKDYLRYRLTGTFATDMCDASGTQLFACGPRQWEASLVEFCGLDRSCLPNLLEGPEVSGRLSSEAAATLGLRFGTPVVAGAGDAAAAALGLGAITPGNAFISLGTSGQYFSTTQHFEPVTDRHLHDYAHGLPNLWFRMAALLNGASALAWIAGVLNAPSITDLLRETEAAYQGPGSLIFLPYLTGERSPHGNPHATGVLHGLTPGHSRTDLVQAVLEGVCLALADCQDDLGTAPETPVLLAGGGTRSPFWMQMLANVLNRTLLRPDRSEMGAASGAARLALMAHTGAAAQDVCFTPPIIAHYHPEPQILVRYGERLEPFRALYRAVENHFGNEPAN